ncbi:MAG: ATP-binding cassette domain-containing protein [Bdellovibrionaceae bacterium]|nr:ATP-binding cassette domain-containing protein [Pseudobdellovibrionaceae bacterium]MDW8189446.1 ATP-binding cassette domain-containing protein [Pseudobdellovibrionaceae bacterium]
MALKPILVAHNVGFEWDHQPIFQNINLSLYPNERVVMMGPSGHGKTTLLKILAGLLRPTLGTVSHFDHGHFYDLPAQNQRQIQRQIGLLFQKNALFDSLTALENITFALEESGECLSPEEAKSRAAHELDLVGLAHAGHLLPANMSGGMQKRLGIARAQALKPKILFYDDPTAGLDPITSRHIVDLIIRLQQERASTVLIVTNDLHRAWQVGQRVLFLYRGSLLELGSPEDALNNPDPVVRQFLSGSSNGPLTEELGH